MSSAPAGWYEDPEAPGAPRYWNGGAWLASGERPTAAATELFQQNAMFTPSASAQHEAEFRPTPATNYADPSATAEGQADGALGAEQDVPWDVVGMPRQANLAATNPSSRPGWSPPEQQEYGSAVVAPSPYRAPANYGAPPHYQQSSYSAPAAAVPYDYAPAARRRFSPLRIIASIAAFVVAAFGVNWGLQTFLGGHESVVVAASATPSVPAQPSTDPSADAPSTAISTPDDEMTTPSGWFTFLVDPTWLEDSSSMENPDVAPGETPVGAWWTKDRAAEPNAAWIAVSEYALPGATLEQVHQDAVNAFVVGSDVTETQSLSFDLPNGMHETTTTVQASVEGVAVTAMVYTFESGEHFLTFFGIGTDPSEVGMSMGYVSFDVRSA